MKLLIGLGNPGAEYADTRHNVGWRVVELCARRWDAGAWKMERALQSRVATAVVGDMRVVLVEPQTYMNLSGEAVSKVLKYYKLTPADMLVVHDDKDLAFPMLRQKKGGGSGGHNGIASIVQHVGTGDFSRIKIGVANELLTHMDTADFVLGRFGADEKKVLEEKVLGEVCEKVEGWMADFAGAK